MAPTSAATKAKSRCERPFAHEDCRFSTVTHLRPPVKIWGHKGAASCAGESRLAKRSGSYQTRDYSSGRSKTRAGPGLSSRGAGSGLAPRLWLEAQARNQFTDPQSSGLQEHKALSFFLLLPSRKKRIPRCRHGRARCALRQFVDSVGV